MSLEHDSGELHERGGRGPESFFFRACQLAVMSQ